jgi:hypothetical protein
MQARSASERNPRSIPGKSYSSRRSVDVDLAEEVAEVLLGAVVVDAGRGLHDYEQVAVLPQRAPGR